MGLDASILELKWQYPYMNTEQAFQKEIQSPEGPRPLADRHAGLDLYSLTGGNIDVYVFMFNIELFLERLDIRFLLSVYDKIGDDKRFYARAHLTLIDGANIDPYMIRLLANLPPPPSVSTYDGYEVMESFTNLLGKPFTSSVLEVLAHLDVCKKQVLANYSKVDHRDFLLDCHRFFVKQKSYILKFAYNDPNQRLWRLNLQDVAGSKPICLRDRFPESQTLRLFPNSLALHKEIQNQYKNIFSFLENQGISINPAEIGGVIGFMLSAKTLQDNWEIDDRICGFALYDQERHDLYCHVLFKHSTQEGRRTYMMSSNISISRTATEMRNLLEADVASRSLFKALFDKSLDCNECSIISPKDSPGVANFEDMRIFQSLVFGNEKCPIKGHSIYCKPKLTCHFSIRDSELYGEWETTGVKFMTKIAFKDVANPIGLVELDSKRSTMDEFLSWIVESIPVWRANWRRLHGIS